MGMGIRNINIPARFDRVAAAFDADVARMRLCESSGSEHSLESLSHLVNSFIHREAQPSLHIHDRQARDEEDDDDQNLPNFDNKRKILEGIFTLDDSIEIRREVELAMEILEDKSSPSFKRQLMSHLRHKGFDAGLCKSKCDKLRRFTRDYEYIDVNFAGNRYIVETSLAAEFEIARPTGQYSSLLDVFPSVFVGKVEELKVVVGLMCNAIKGSMKTMDLYIPPWRTSHYMQAKWFSSYRRTTNEVATRNASSSPNFSTKSSIGFEARPVKSYNCKDDYRTKPAFRVGHLTTAFDADGLGM